VGGGAARGTTGTRSRPTPLRSRGHPRSAPTSSRQKTPSSPIPPSKRAAVNANRRHYRPGNSRSTGNLRPLSTEAGSGQSSVTNEFLARSTEEALRPREELVCDAAVSESPSGVEGGL